MPGWISVPISSVVTMHEEEEDGAPAWERSWTLRVRTDGRASAPKCLEIPGLTGPDAVITTLWREQSEASAASNKLQLSSEQTADDVLDSMECIPRDLSLARRLFSELDTEDTGVLSRDDFIKLVRSLLERSGEDQSVSNTDLGFQFDALDQDRVGKVYFAEFSRWWGQGTALVQANGHVGSNQEDQRPDVAREQGATPQGESSVSRPSRISFDEFLTAVGRADATVEERMCVRERSRSLAVPSGEEQSVIPAGRHTVGATAWKSTQLKTRRQGVVPGT